MATKKKNYGSTTVKKHKRKIGKRRFTVKKHKRKIGVIVPRDRKIFELMSSKQFKKERGGYLDFGKKGTGTLEKFDVTTGKATEVDLPADYESLFHTHPDIRTKTYETSGAPSQGDMIMLIKTKKVQASIIFHRGNSYAVIKTPKSRKLNKLTNNQIIKRYDIDDDKELTKKLKDDGFIVIQTKKGKQMRLPIKVVN